MLCKIADLIAEIPTADGLAVRCKNYMHNEDAIPDITVRKELYCSDRFPPRVSTATVA